MRQKNKTDIIKNKIIQIEIAPGVYRATTEQSQYIIEYDKNKCIGASSCAAVAPLTFFMDEENRAMIHTEGSFDSDEIILAGAMSCPVFAIKIYKKSENFRDLNNLIDEKVVFPEND